MFTKKTTFSRIGSWFTIGSVLFLLAGADKVSVNSAAVKRPELLSEGAARFGAQCIVLAIDARRNGSSWA